MSESLILVGSPRAAGVCARYAVELERGLESRDTDSPFAHSAVIWRVCDHEVSGCVGCEACRGRLGCAIEDDMAALMDLIDRVEEIHVVSPVYFAGAPAQLKCVLDRLQPYWERRRGPNAAALQAMGGVGPDAPKRPVYLHVIGAGGDPYGFDPLVTTVRSAFGAAGFTLAQVYDRIGWGQ